MFKLNNENYEIDHKILKCYYIRFSPAEISTLNVPNSRIYIKKTREGFVISSLNSYLDSNFEVIQKVDISRFAIGNDIRLIKLGPIGLFSKFNLTTSSGKHLEDRSHAHIVCLKFKLITTARDTDGLCIGFDRGRNRKGDELTNIKNIKVKYHVRNMLEDVLGFAEQQEKATYGLGYKIT